MKNYPDPNKKWSPQEILALPMPRDLRSHTVENSRSACSITVKEAKILRDRIRKVKVLRFLQTNETATVTQIIKHFQPEIIAIRTVWGYLKVFEQEGRAKCSGRVWSLANKKDAATHE